MTKDQAIKLIERNEFKKVFKELEQFNSNQISIFSSQYNSVQTEKRIGVISYQEASTRMTKITYGVLSCLDELFHNRDSSFSTSMPLGEFLDNLDNRLKEMKKSSRTNHKSELLRFIGNMETFLRGLGSDFVEIITETVNIKTNFEMVSIDQNTVIEFLQELSDSLEEFRTSDAKKGGLAALKEKAIEDGSSVDSMFEYINALKKAKKITKHDQEELRSNYKAKKSLGGIMSSATAKRWLRSKIRTL